MREVYEGTIVIIQSHVYWYTLTFRFSYLRARTQILSFNKSYRVYSTQISAKYKNTDNVLQFLYKLQSRIFIFQIADSICCSLKILVIFNFSKNSVSVISKCCLMSFRRKEKLRYLISFERKKWNKFQSFVK